MKRKIFVLISLFAILTMLVPAGGLAAILPDTIDAPVAPNNDTISGRVFD